MTTTPETEELTEEGSDPGAVFTTTEDPTWSRTASQMIKMADTATTTECSAEIILKTRPKLRNEIGDQGSRATTLEHTARLKNNSMDHARYTDSEMSEESSDQDTF